MCHLIFVCKYRKPLLAKLGDTIKTILNDISEEIDVEILEMEKEEIMSLEITLGKGQYVPFTGLSKFEDNIDMLILGYNILKEPQESGSKVIETNVGPEIVKLCMTPEYCQELIELLQKLLKKNASKAKLEEIETSNFKATYWSFL